MLDDEAKEKGYALMCVAEPQSDCRIRVIEEVSLHTSICLHLQASKLHITNPSPSCYQDHITLEPEPVDMQQ